MRGIRLLIFFFLLILSARAQTWIGLGGDSNWSTAANWSPSGAPANNGTASLTFDDTSLTNFTPFIEQNYDIASLHFYSNNSYSFDGAGGTTLTLENGLDSDAPGNVTFSSNIGFSLSQNQEWDIYGDTLEISGVISGPGALTLRSDTTGFLQLDSTNTYTGGTILEDGLSLSLNANDALGTGTLDITGNSTIAAQSNLTLANAVTVESNFTIQNSTNASLTLSGPVTLTASPTISLFSDSSSPLIITGDVSESGGPQSLTVDGGGALQLSGNNAYTGGTTIINSSTVVAGSNNALGTGSVTVDTGGTLAVDSGSTLTNPLTLTNGTLAGVGTFAPSNGALTIGTGQIVSPGFIQTNSDHMPVNASVGTLTFSPGLTLDSGGTLALKFINATGTAGTDWDQIVVNGALNLTATSSTPFNLTLASYNNTTGAPDVLAGFDSSSGYTWLIASTTSITGFDPTAFTIDTTVFQNLNSLGIGGFYLTQSGNSLYLNFSPVPEPSTVALLSLGVSVLVVSGRRRRRR
jgi:autotransporter-associated beta strand protein